ncbi:hypothetical protein F4808DRAFT_60551 [Astrocystis sublimbata]|nr:hypothetical protein F4808DRAFT_60551 [Astrocystis sublimbata]
MARLFHTTAKALVRWLGYAREDLPESFKQAAEHYAENGARKVIYTSPKAPKELFIKSHTRYRKSGKLSQLRSCTATMGQALSTDRSSTAMTGLSLSVPELRQPTEVAQERTIYTRMVQARSGLGIVENIPRLTEDSERGFFLGGGEGGISITLAYTDYFISRDSYISKRQVIKVEGGNARAYKNACRHKKLPPFII